MNANGTTSRPKILVTLDGSHFSEAILGPVMNLAPALGAEVILFCVGRASDAHDTPVKSSYTEMTIAAAPTGTPFTNMPLPSALSPSRVETRQQALNRIDADLRAYLADRAEELANVQVTIAVDIDDDPAHAIVAYARRIHPDLIAMATHGRTGLGHLLAGSVCEAVIRSSIAPVLVLRP